MTAGRRPSSFEKSRFISPIQIEKPASGAAGLLVLKFVTGLEHGPSRHMVPVVVRMGVLQHRKNQYTVLGSHHSAVRKQETADARQEGQGTVLGDLNSVWGRVLSSLA